VLQGKLISSDELKIVSVEIIVQRKTRFLHLVDLYAESLILLLTKFDSEVLCRISNNLADNVETLSFCKTHLNFVKVKLD